MRVLDRVTAEAFRAVSRLRGTRSVHPQGVAFTAGWHGAARAGDQIGRDDAAAPLPGVERDALVRFSRGVGLPPGLPDILGVAVRILDAHGPGADQDLLLAGTGAGPLSRRILLPARAFERRTYSTLLAYATPQGRGPLLARLCASVPGERPAATPLAGLDEAWGARRTLQVALPGRGLLGELRLAGRLPHEAAANLCFDPWHTGEGLRPVGWLNRLRRPAYAASQQGRGAPTSGAHGDPPTG